MNSPISIRVAILLAGLFSATPAIAQNGDRDGETQMPLPADLEIPAAPRCRASR